jgi:hypothetical protein
VRQREEGRAPCVGGLGPPADEVPVDVTGLQPVGQRVTIGSPFAAVGRCDDEAGEGSMQLAARTRRVEMLDWPEKMCASVPCKAKKPTSNPSSSNPPGRSKYADAVAGRRWTKRAYAWMTRCTSFSKSAASRPMVNRMRSMTSRRSCRSSTMDCAWNPASVRRKWRGTQELATCAGRFASAPLGVRRQQPAQLNLNFTTSCRIYAVRGYPSQREKSTHCIHSHTGWQQRARTSKSTFNCNDPNWHVCQFGSYHITQEAAFPGDLTVID